MEWSAQTWLIVVLLIGFWCWMLIEWFRRGEFDEPLEWVVVFSPIGGLVYLLCCYVPRRIQESPAIKRRRRMKELRVLQQVIGLNIDQVRELGDLYRDQRQWVDALQCYQDALQRFPDHQATRLEIVRCLTEMQRMQEAVSELERVADQDIFYKQRATLLLTQILMKLGHPDQALARLKAIHTSDSPMDLAYQYAVCLVESGHRAEAKSILERLVVREPLVSREGQEWISKAKTLLKSISRQGA